MAKIIFYSLMIYAYSALTLANGRSPAIEPTYSIETDKIESTKPSHKDFFDFSYNAYHAQQRNEIAGYDRSPSSEKTNPITTFFTLLGLFSIPLLIRFSIFKWFKVATTQNKDLINPVQVEQKDATVLVFHSQQLNKNSVDKEDDDDNKKAA